MALDTTMLHRITRRAVAEIVSEEEFVKLLQEGKPLRLKMGFDPSRPDLTLGHVVGLRKLRQLQELGHQVILIVGDWTAQIGDPSGQSQTRPMLTAETVRENAQTYLRQFFRIVDRDKTQVVWQSEWFGAFTMADVIRLTSRFTVAQFLQREDFRKRFDAGRPIAITELLYPLLQAYDSVAIRSDVEFGGMDQKFNLLVGRELQSMMGQRPQQCFLVPLLVGTDGAVKMSKSLGNFIAVEEPPQDQYGKVMALPDSAIVHYYELVTDVPDEELAEIERALEQHKVNPMAHKKRLAYEVVKLLNLGSDEVARSAQEHFERTVQRGELPEEMPIVKVATDATRLSRVLVDAGLATSMGDARRLITQRAVEVNGVTATADELPKPLAEGDVIRVGKRRYARVVR
ncbi:MAG: tyrosine--tRNA ligase [Dehalococcoidia bacterium]|nr:tyrosine--tRNA ligase [Dehalococcoidia bacterium]